MTKELVNKDGRWYCEDGTAATDAEIADFVWGTPEQDEYLKGALFGIYLSGLSELYNFYAHQADLEGLWAVYNAGLEAGKLEKEL